MNLSFELNPRFAKLFDDLKTKTIKIGIAGVDMYDSSGELTNVVKGIVHELGATIRKVSKKGKSYTITIPARPFLRPVVMSKDYLAKALRAGLKKFSIGTVGDVLAGEVRMYIKNMTQPRNAGGDDRFLIDSGGLQKSIACEVVDA